MKLRDNSTNEEIILHRDFLWIDEMEWTPVAKSANYSLAGSLVIQHGVKLAGRPITLEGPTEMAWLPREKVLKLQEWAANPTRRYTLLLEYPTDNRTFTVVFAPGESPVEASPVKEFPEHTPDAWYKVKMKFIEVQA